METRIDFLQWLEVDMALKIISCLDDPADLIRASVVSRFWHKFVISNGLCKSLGVKLFPQLRNVALVTEPDSERKECSNGESSSSAEREARDREHGAYAFLVRALTTFTPIGCVEEAVSASSTDNYPEESIRNTLDPRDRVLRRASYWSSKGQKNPAVPETLIYKLISNLCVISEISVQPFKAFFQPGDPIYSAKSVRFRIGHPKSLIDIENDIKDLPLQFAADDKFVWTYTSQEFPMAQENRLQKFKLSEPVLCIGGFLQIELLGRIQRQEMDGLFYICVSHAEVTGQSLFPAFDVEILEPTGSFVLKYYPDHRNKPPPTSPYGALLSRQNLLQENLRGLEQLLNLLHGNVENLQHHHEQDAEYAHHVYDNEDDDPDDDDDDGDDIDDMFAFGPPL